MNATLQAAFLFTEGEMGEQEDMGLDIGPWRQPWEVNGQSPGGHN